MKETCITFSLQCLWHPPYNLFCAHPHTQVGSLFFFDDYCYVCIYEYAEIYIYIHIYKQPAGSIVAGSIVVVVVAVAGFAHMTSELTTLPPTLAGLFILPLLWTCLGYFYEKLFYKRLAGILGLRFFPLHYPQCSLSHSCRSYNVDVSSGTRLPTTYWFLHCVQLCFSVMVSVWCKEKLLWQGVVDAVICGCKDKI